MDHSRQVVHRTILAVDIEGYGDPRRTTPHRLAVRRALDQALRRAFNETGVPWFDCRHENTGDGTFVLVPAQIPKGPFVEVLSVALARELRQHNGTHPPEERIRLRMALHAGEVAYDDQGATAPAINQTFRLLEAPPLKDALATSPGVLALITSAWFFDEVVRSSVIVDARTFRPVHVAVKETSTTGWISLPDHPYPPEPPPRQPDAGHCTLPRDLPVCTGRTRELAALTTAVAAHGTLGTAVHVIHGMPGTGKTTFAIHAAHQLAARFPDGQIFLELHGHHPAQAPVAPADALASLLLLLGVPALAVPAGADDRARLWREKLTGKKVLLLLDDALDDDQIRPLLPGGGGSLVLITSRHRLEAIADAGRVCLPTLPAEPDVVAELLGQLPPAGGDDYYGRAREAIALMNLGRLHHAAGDHRTAFLYLTRAQELLGEDRSRQAENLNNLGGLALEWPEAGDPVELYSRALDMAHTAGVRLEAGRALEGLARTALKAADQARAAEYLHQALALYQKLAVPVVAIGPASPGAW